MPFSPAFTHLVVAVNGIFSPVHSHYYSAEFARHDAGDAIELAHGSDWYNFKGAQGHLLTINTEAELEDVTFNLLSKYPNTWFWIGASDALTPGQWSWVTGPDAGNQVPLCVLETLGENVNNYACLQVQYNSGSSGPVFQYADCNSPAPFVVEYQCHEGFFFGPRQCEGSLM